MHFGNFLFSCCAQDFENFKSFRISQTKADNKFCFKKASIIVTITFLATTTLRCLFLTFCGRIKKLSKVHRMEVVELMDKQVFDK